MHLTAITPILNVSDVPASIAWFLKLGWGRCWSWNSGGMMTGDADSNAHGPATFAGGVFVGESRLPGAGGVSSNGTGSPPD